MLEIILNILTLILAVACVGFCWAIYHITKAKAVLALLGAFVWSVVIRASVLAEIPYVSDHTRPLTFVTFLFYTVAMAILYRALLHFYHK